MVRGKRQPSVAVIGAGAGGIAMGVRLKQAGYNFTLYEKSDGVGGTWRDNTYPGAACDVPSHLYSFSFAPNPGWSRTYATQQEILAYLERCTDQFDLRPHIRLFTRINEARWIESDQEWVLDAGPNRSFRADVLVSALGMLNVPNVPDIPGAEIFTGRMFHSSRWDHSAPYADERVASIGTGASAVQYVPAIAPHVAQLTVFQRSPIWISPRLDRPYSEKEQRRFQRLPFAARLHRSKIWWTYERSNFKAGSPQTLAQTEFARSYLERKINQPELRQKLTPDYPVGCKRPLMSRAWYPTLLRPNVRLVTEEISEITKTGIRTVDGKCIEVDTIIFGTGFRAHDFLSAVEIKGKGGRRIRDDWRGGAEAYLGISVSGYPNLFLLYGPNTNGVNSILFFHEAQAHYIMRALRIMTRRGFSSLEVKREVMDRYNRKIQSAMRETVWTAGCRNYFCAPNGKVVTQLPYSGGRYWLRTRGIRSWRYHKQKSIHG